jgi:hypothetical protein
MTHRAPHLPERYVARNDLLLSRNPRFVVNVKIEDIILWDEYSP